MNTLIKMTVMSLIGWAAISPGFAAPQVYIPLGDANQIQIIDAATNRTTGTVTDVFNVHGLSITPDGRFLVAGSMTATESGQGDAPPKPADVSQAEHEKHHAKPAAGASKNVGISYVSIIDAASRQVVRRLDVAGAVHHVAISPDGRYAVTTHPGAGGISVIDLKSNTVARTIDTGPAPNYAVFTEDGRHVYVSNAGDDSISEVATNSWTVERRFATGRSPEHVVLSLDGKALYVNNVADGTVSEISLANGRIARTFQVGGVPHGIEVSDDGRTLFASSKAEGRVAAVDLSSGTVRQVQLAPEPYHITALRGSGKLYVSSRAEQRIWIVDQSTLSVHGEIYLNGIGHQMVIAAG